MAISYAGCLEVLHSAADAARTARSQPNRVDCVLTQDAFGRIAAGGCVNSHAAPLHDTSAMDGFIVDSSATVDALPTSPATFTIVGEIVPGQVPQTYPDACTGEENICLEVMTGGRFPTKDDKLSKLDACVPIEDVSITTCINQDTTQEARRISITKPVQPMAHRRIGGADIPANTVLIGTGERVLTSHILPLVSSGVHEVHVVAKPRIGIWSTGHEYVSGTSGSAADVNGPYLTAICREFGADASFLGYLDDEPRQMAQAFRQTVESGEFDVLLTTGAVSAGKFDFVREALAMSNADVLFHGLNIRPGHPALFAWLPCDQDEESIPFFGLPGNPGAASVCFRFLVVPYLRRLLGREAEMPQRALAARARMGSGKFSQQPEEVVFAAKHNCDYFVPGRVGTLSNGINLVEVCDKASPARMEPFIQANCWVHVRSGQNLTIGQVVDYFDMSLAMN